MVRRIAALSALLGIAACSLKSDTGEPQQPIPLSAVLAQLSQNAQVRERLLQSLDQLPDAWGLIGPNQRAQLRDYIFKRDWSAIDHFPGLTVSQLRASVTVANAAARRYPFGGDGLAPPYVEVGDFSADRGSEASWAVPQKALTTSAAPAVKDLGYGLTMGDPPHPELWRWHAQSERAAFLLNRLALNPMLPANAALRVRLDRQTARSPEELVAALSQSGCEVWIEDARYFANFGHLHFEKQDVLMPFWLNTRLRIPGSRQDLLVPVSHAEEELRIRCAPGNADVSFYFGIDGMAEFRTMDTLDQYWVGKNAAHTFRDMQAVEVVRLLGATLRTYAKLHRKHPELPFRGYYRLGVCQDAIAAIEKHFFGTVTLFPITHDPEFFDRGSEIDHLFAPLPDDRTSSYASWKRVRGSMPAADLADIRIPALRQTLLLFAAKEDLIRTEQTFGIPASIVVICALVLLLWWRRRRRREKMAA